MVLLDYTLTTFVTLMVVVDPIGLAPVFLSITQSLSKLAGRVAGALGHTGNVVLPRLLGVVLAALAVQFVIDGGREAFG